MAKKRKAPKTFDQPQSAKSAKYDIEETFNDSEDEFYAGRDKVLLDHDPETKRRKRILEQEKDLQLSDEEILPYQDDATSEEDLGSQDEDESASEIDGDGGQPFNGTADDQDESEEEYWGTNRADYYGDDTIETEEQAREEEAEAKRLHQKQLKNMTEADFGFDESEWAQEKKDTKTGRSVTEKLPEAQIPDGASKTEKLHIINSRYPELTPLADDFARLQELKTELEQTSEAISKRCTEGATLGDGIPVGVKLNALNAYLASISMYMAVLSAQPGNEPSSRRITAANPLELHDHPVIQVLARSRDLWDQVETLQHANVLTEPQQLPTPEDEFLEIDIETKPKSRTTEPARKKKPSKNTSQRAVGRIAGGDPIKSKPPTLEKKSKRDSKEKKKPLDLSALIAQTQDNTADDDLDSDFGDEQPLTEEQYAEKARKRKSLRFYTANLAAKAHKRGQASRIAGGDDDLPHKERQKDKRERLLKEAEARGRQQGDVADDFGDGDDYDDLPRNARDTNDDYYDTLLNAKQKKKSEKQARADAYAQAAKEGATVYEEETVGPDGKRAITYAIAKNKGLTPKRKKEVRNPRVKKRMKYDEKLKKLGSIRQVYKGGEGKGGYGGELTGIKTNVVKSVKL